jgi:hypothetical protein
MLEIQRVHEHANGRHENYYRGSTGVVIVVRDESGRDANLTQMVTVSMSQIPMATANLNLH